MFITTSPKNISRFTTVQFNFISFEALLGKYIYNGTFILEKYSFSLSNYYFYLKVHNHYKNNQRTHQQLFHIHHYGNPVKPFLKWEIAISHLQSIKILNINYYQWKFKSVDYIYTWKCILNICK